MSRLLVAVSIFLLASCHKAEHPPHASLLHVLEQTGDVQGPPALQVDARTTEITRYPCVRCHDKPIAALRRAKPAAHWEIRLAHAPGVIDECKTCHGEGKMESLLLLNGKTAAFDASYELCGQCHSRQLADWRGGAHGKRTSGWAGERRVRNCTGCHNPHQPRFAPRWPSVSRNRGKETP